MNNSVFGKTQAKQALRLRKRFRNDVNGPDPDSAIKLMDRLYAVYNAARLEHGCQQIANAKRGPSRPYGGRRGKLRETSPAAILDPRQMSRRELCYYKLHQTNWDIPTSTVVSEEAVMAGIARLQAEIGELTRDGRFQREHDAVAAVQNAWGSGPQRPIGDETLEVFRCLPPTSRFDVLAAFHKMEHPMKPMDQRVANFLTTQSAWRKDQSWHACLILSQFERDLRNNRLFSAVDLQSIEIRYHVDTLPGFAKLRHVQTRTARIAIAMVACGSVNGTSSRIAIDQSLAHAAAHKFNAFLAKSASRRKSP
ncbi:hypothetical protein VQ042_24655 [Aurantimonas sp. A2-1-M11]|uniref:hypothetical protein n=1 Tax=Aurantimonas sp. A2-1-M11 TaxID=3113712 RepID=UPI002F9246B9